ncbi:LOB domain-containing protein 16 [Sesamum angolense]|uniref:LOB domain-containing protein 16 n=1 Tax=Sesamum angolense TaxID=2727404 RepID=A0AAE1XB01_9LAMI|nr:LOB domain-containing protein 16 [Sesamum angolense]
MATGAGSPCGACKFLRRKCAADCVFAPYFCSEQGPARFAAIHKVFGASNVSKLPVPDRCEAVVTIAYEAQARIRDPVYGCVAHIFALQQQVNVVGVCFLDLSYDVSVPVAYLWQVKAQLAQTLMDQSSRNAENLWPGSMGPGPTGPLPFPGSFPDHMNSNSVEHHSDGIHQGMQETDSRDDLLTFQAYSRKRPSQTDLSELQALAFRMMKNEN